MKPIPVFSTAILLIMTGLPAPAADTKDKAISDAEFLVQATNSGVAEVRLSEFAARNAQDVKVRAFADQLVKDHKALNNVIVGNAGRLKIAVVAGLDKETRDRLDQLSRLKGTELAETYLKWMVSDHEAAIKLFEAESKSGQDPDLRTVAKNNLPILRKHLEDARANLNRIKK